MQDDDDDEVDGCSVVEESTDSVPDEEVDYVVLFAEALDPQTSKTVEEAAAEWQELFG